MMHNLIVPLILTCRGIYRDHRISEQIGALPVCAVVIARRTSEGHVDDVAGLVGGHGKSPVVDARTVFPVVALPDFVTGLTRPRHGVELPQLCSGPHIIS